jgi:3'(2'), 5'-bisphosphate nucleotidase
MTTNELSRLLPEICNLAQSAGLKAMQFYRKNTAVTLKSDSSPLTDADRASHDLIERVLSPLLPGVPVISEESQGAAQTPPSGSASFWLVDPLDGTKEFLKGTGEFTVNIALIQSGQPILGVVHAPALGRAFFADHLNGAFRVEQGQSPAPIRVQRTHPRKLRMVASKDHAGPQVQAMLQRLDNPELKSMGSSLKFCLVAEGQADVYLRDVPTMEWDTAAAQCIVEAAGGRVCTLDGRPLRYAKPGLKNPAIIAVGDPELRWEQFLDRG